MRNGPAAAALAAMLFLSLQENVDRALSLAAYAFAGWDVVTRAIRNCFRGSVFDEQLLMTIATVGAFAIGALHEAVAVMLFYQIGELLQNRAVARVLRLVEEASERKARTEQFITRFARIYTPAVVGVAALLALLPPLLFGAGFSEWLHRALVVLVVSCPCALVVSVPLSFFASIGAASRRGVLAKGAQLLERLKAPTTVVFDKTGTRTIASG